MKNRFEQVKTLQVIAPPNAPTPPNVPFYFLPSHDIVILTNQSRLLHIIPKIYLYATKYVKFDKNYFFALASQVKKNIFYFYENMRTFQSASDTYPVYAVKSLI